MAIGRDNLIIGGRAAITMAESGPELPLPVDDRVMDEGWRRFLRRVRPHLMGILRAIDDECDTHQKATCPHCGHEFKVGKT